MPSEQQTREFCVDRERESKPRFAEMNTIEQTIGLKWKELELQEKQLLEEVKQRMQYASEHLQAEIDQMFLDHEAQLLREGQWETIELFDRSREEMRVFMEIRQWHCFCQERFVKRGSLSERSASRQRRDVQISVEEMSSTLDSRDYDKTRFCVIENVSLE